MGIINTMVIFFIMRYGLQILAITMLIGFLGNNHSDVLTSYIDFSKSMVNEDLVNGITGMFDTATNSVKETVNKLDQP